MKPIGATEKAPVVVLTVDIASFIRQHVKTDSRGKQIYKPLLEQLEAAKERGQITHGVSYDILKRIYREDYYLTSEVVAEEILVSYGLGMTLGKEIPLYRNPNLTDGEFYARMKKRLTVELPEGEVDEEITWNKKRDEAFIESFPRIEMPL